MTIASEITRLQWAKADIKTAIEWKWVSVPSSAKLDSYAWYIGNISTGTFESIFIPSSYILADNIRNTNRWVGVKADIWDIVTADESVYYHYLWVTDPQTTAHDFWRVYAWRKVPWQNPTFVPLGWIDEWNWYYYSTTLNRWIRMKKSWTSSVMMSSLVRKWYWSSGSWSMTSNAWYCINVTDTTSQVVTLMTGRHDEWSAVPADVLEAWTNSCWITAAESIASIWKTSISIARWSEQYLFTVTATLNI